MLQKLDHWADESYIFNYKVTTEQEPVQVFHAHAGVEILYVHEGSGRCIVEDQVFEIQPNTLIVYKPYQLHYFNVTIPPAYTRSLIKIKEASLEQLKVLFPLHYEKIMELLSVSAIAHVYHLTERQSLMMEEQFEHLNRTINEQTRQYIRETILEFLLFFFSFLQRNLLNAQGDSKLEASTKNQHVQRILSWVSQHYKEEVSLEKVAEDLHLTPNYLSTLFRQQTGRHLIEYISERRLELSRTLLHHPDFSVTQICQEVGFQSPSYFIQQFRKKYKVTPKQYRQTSMNMQTGAP